MKKIKMMFGLIMSFVMAGAVANAATLDVMTILKKSDEALEAMLAGTRKLVISLKDGEQVTSEWVARRAHKSFADGKRQLIVILEPEDLKGNAYLYWKPTDQPIIGWVYSTPTRRVRKLMVANAYESFFASDFTYVDFGIEDPGGGTYKLLGEEEYGGRKGYKVETVPKENWYYARIVSLISSDNFIPIKRDFYDVAGRLWKTELFENVSVINNIPIALRIRMLDVQRNHSTEVTFSDVCFDAEYLTEEDFVPEKLPEATLSPVCTVRPPQKEK